MQQFNISIYRAEKDMYQGDLFLEIAESLCYGLQSLGFVAEINKDKIMEKRSEAGQHLLINILLGYFDVPTELVDVLPDNCIYLNTEQLDSLDHATMEHYFRWKKTFLD